VGKCWTAGQSAYGNIMQRMRLACWTTKVTDTYAEYVTLIVFFHGSNGYANASECYVMRALPFLLLHLIRFIFSFFLSVCLSAECARVVGNFTDISKDVSTA
jgi:hypothetical protein